MKLADLQKKFYYIQVRDKFEILKAGELLEQIGITVFNSDEHRMSILKKDSKTFPNVDKFFIIKDGDGWRIQSHFIASDNTIEELEEAVKIYLRKKDKEKLSEEEREKANKQITKLSKELKSFLCYLYLNYDNEDDVKEVYSRFNLFINKLSERWDDNYEYFKNRDDFESKLASFI